MIGYIFPEPSHISVISQKERLMYSFPDCIKSDLQLETQNVDQS